MNDVAARAWGRMLDLVLERNDRRKEVVDALGMSFVKTKALRRLAARPMTMRELAEELLTDRPYATVLVDDLERRGLVQREVHPEDRRSKIVSVTPAGRAVSDTSAQILQRAPASLLALPEEDLAALDRILARLAE
ncbi:MarR family winged helix-turn-helix transcriptional regulator [Amycolatopsis alkalitolerans]|uniref:MarR family winged helix-turn-helix transcriptional regulator n=1 Tax=Amycolatopsis alkalitolerans TaxID=2547244 RepID=UPI001F2A1F23|nr:MarR family transcriptional regulator [Amycolatopsis alkalitolerans]